MDTLTYWDHPHAYGDKNRPQLCNLFFAGSSPRVWGQVNGLFAKREIERIIPTRMGTRVIVILKDCIFQDHPHAYGDKPICSGLFYFHLGSSPRVWGQGCYTDLNNECDRIIPTRMGTRHNNLKFDSQLKDHPHAYGDKCSKSAPQILQLGSSPRVWGQDICINNPDNSVRIIPTRMGTRFFGGLPICVK